MQLDRTYSSARVIERPNNLLSCAIRTWILSLFVYRLKRFFESHSPKLAFEIMAAEQQRRRSAMRAMMRIVG